jgi:hypothetical protein
VTISTEGPNQGVSGTCTDNAGNVGSASTTVSIDKTPPTVAANISPMPTNGWNNGPVSVSFSGSDALSGIDSCDPSVPVNAEGANQLVTGTCTDNAGNMANASATVNIDTTPPVVAATANPAPNANGWNNTDVIVTFSVVSDNLSGAGTCDPAATVSGPGQNLSATGSCSDLAGNSASASASGINIDKTAPTVEVTGVAHNVVYTLGSVPAAGCSTSDALSGVATNATLSSGGPVGLITATCSGATDNAGNGAASVSVTYRVIYDFDGFFRPVDNLPMMNVVKAGSAIPVKFSLNGNFGLNIFAANSPSVSQSVSCMALPADVISPSDTVTAGGSSLSYDAVSDQYNYVWKTDRSWAGQCRVLQVTLSDGTIHLAYFHFSR